RAAGVIAMKYYTGGFDVTMKPDDTPVTQADREAEEAIVTALGRAFPDWGFLGEEFGAQGATDIRWIIDPIDGTKNFVRRIPIWATLLALDAWGLGAGRSVVGEAGGPFAGLGGMPAIYSGDALASNGRLHDAALALLAGR